jgi:hypothetical protein
LERPVDVTPIESAKSYNGNGRTVSGPDPSVLTTRLASPVDASIIVRLHFAEAMMVLLFNASDEKHQDAVKRGFGRLLAKMDNLEMLGTPTGTLQAYRDALSAMQAMLASSPEPEELADALADDFAKRFLR